MSIRILICGENSYIGTSFVNWLNTYEDRYVLDTVSTRNNVWNNINFNQYDIVLHVAGIAHVNAKKDMKDLYYKVNRDLAVEVAKKAKREGVKQFIFMSSIIVYGKESFKDKNYFIRKDTVPCPSNFYGDSKLQAELAILPMQSNDFNVVILRPPMIYGKNSKGNYPKLSILAKVWNIYPDIENCRSILYVNNLCEFIRLLIDDNAKGIFYPQNNEYVKTLDIIQEIATINKKKVYTTKIFNPIIFLLMKKFAILDKIYGNLAYDKEMSVYNRSYCITDFKQSITETEMR